MMAAWLSILRRVSDELLGKSAAVRFRLASRNAAIARSAARSEGGKSDFQNHSARRSRLARYAGQPIEAGKHAVLHMVSGTAMDATGPKSPFSSLANAGRLFLIIDAMITLPGT
jgi:hypothetical protein